MSRLLIGLLLVLAWTAGGRLALAAEAPHSTSSTRTGRPSARSWTTTEFLSSTCTMRGRADASVAEPEC